MSDRDRHHLLRTGMAAVAVGLFAVVAACGGGSDETGARRGTDTSDIDIGGTDTGGTDTSSVDTSRSDEGGAAGNGGSDVSPQEFCDAYFGIDVDPTNYVEFGEAAAQLTPPAEIAEEWDAMLDGDIDAVQDVTTWTIANCPQMNG
jgi:hypothetical protein